MDGNEDRTELRPNLRDCPFCHTKGSDDEKLHFIGNLMICNEVEYVGSYSIFCTGCGTQLHDEYRDDLVNRWNGVIEEDGTDQESEVSNLLAKFMV